ncbi:GNAT family N-acetyltransferase [Brucella sp. NBRC 12950]|uniref:GNAT family N-acetyltransferase n=1 Tax=Brucella sp. NBRC 12950 TaxID=2994518 RepID=UPI002555954D|nr:GNAT family N-acetyltransferase [Brucella sp. NBRC 12950]
MTDENRSQVSALKIGVEQIHWVASNIESLLEADEDEDARPRAILADARLVGFLMYDATSEPGTAQLYRFMIDKSFQGLGYGKVALRALLAEIGAFGGINSVSVCYDPENLPASRLYAQAGFVEIGLDEDDEMIARMSLEG